MEYKYRYVFLFHNIIKNCCHLQIISIYIYVNQLDVTISWVFKNICDFTKHNQIKGKIKLLISGLSITFFYIDLIY